MAWFTHKELCLCLVGVLIIYLGFLSLKSIWTTVKLRSVIICINIFYAIICLACLDSIHTDILVLASLGLVNFWINCGFIFFDYSQEKIKPIPNNNNYVHYFSKIFCEDNITYTNIVDFWKVNYKQRKSTNKFNLIWELPTLVVGSFYTLIRTRFLFLQNLFLIRATYLIFLGNYFWLCFYLGPMLLLTLFFSVPQVKSYFLVNYGEDGLKKLGWNSAWNALLDSSVMVGRTIVGSFLLLVGGHIADGEVSHKLNKLQVIRERADFVDAEQFWLNHRIGPPPVPPDEKVILEQRLIPKAIDTIRSLDEIFFRDKFK